ncbi:MAG: glutamate-5-semialdehyde dehydrogenase [Cryobacterium sp.]|nr:glutamate-5-semialdehyde dehydrogenase [Oligoflexia bacterium]
MTEKLFELKPELDRALTEAAATSRALRASSEKSRNAVLVALEKKLSSESHSILKANAADLAALSREANAAFRDRLTLTPERLEGMRESLRQVIRLEDPLGEVVEAKRLENGLIAKRVRSPLGLILMIFESRPNVAIEAFSLALKSGNALVLRGGKESRETVTVLYRLIGESLSEAGLPPQVFFGMTDPDREMVRALLAEKDRIDVVVPRGGDGLIQFVVENARMPIIKNDRGMCHLYVHSDADLDRAVLILENAKVQRPGVCNSVETVIIHSAVLSSFVEKMGTNEGLRRVEFRADAKSYSSLDHAFPGRVREADVKDFDTEYLDLILNVKVVDSASQAMAHIETHGSKHSEAILTRDEKLARLFQSEVDAAAVYWNASTRFTDGFELGLGGELGISTQKLHVRGPVGLRELTSIRWIIDGQGQIR